MKTNLSSKQSARRGYSIVMVLIVGTCTLIVLGGALGWTFANSDFTGRNNQYFTTVSAAEAATEKVLANISRDYQSQGDALVDANLAAYRTLVPTAAESSYWADYEFNDGQGGVGQNYIAKIQNSTFKTLASQYSGLHGYATTYRVISNARDLKSRFNLPTAVKQDIELATIPLFQFAIFYNMDCEINPGPAMTVTGPVFCNTSIYCQPVNSLTFNSDVMAVGQIINDKKAGDPNVRNLSNSQLAFLAEHDGGVSSLNLPIGTNNSPAAVREVVEVPPVGESPTSDMGKQRFYNKADLIVKVTDSGITVNSGLVNNFATVVPWSQASYFISTNVSFVNKRENKTIKAVQIDVAKLKVWSTTNNTIHSILPQGEVSQLYVTDQRTQTASTESGVRLVNGSELPALGLTVTSPNPVYIQGNYNAPAAVLNQNVTTGTKPAAIIADAVNILSTAWSDANANSALSSRIAQNTTVNTAILTGIVPTSTSPNTYSGGVENLPRFLEDWGGGKTFTYNGSMVVMFNSKFALAPWGGSNVYSPPVRHWAFDPNFTDATKLPPGTPSVRAMVRGGWAMIKANTVNDYNWVVGGGSSF